MSRSLSLTTRKQQLNLFDEPIKHTVTVHVTETELIGYTDDPNAFSLVSNWLKHNNIKSYYVRKWKNNHTIHIDYGSHVNIIHVKENDDE